MANSIPKSGTHMLMRLFTLLGVSKSTLFVPPPVADNGFPTAERLLRKAMPSEGTITIGAGSFAEVNRTWLEWRLRLVRRGAFFGGHCVYMPELDRLLRKNQVQMVGIIRDPRDVAVSYMNYVQQAEDHFFHRGYTVMSSDHERLLFSICGGKLDDQALRPLGETYREFLKWRSEYDALVIRFEDLVGVRGGGSAELQQRTIERVCDYLDLSTPSETVSLVQEKLFGVGATFREGRIGGWKNEFSEEHKIAIERQFGSLLSELGYES